METLLERRHLKDAVNKLAVVVTCTDANMNYKKYTDSILPCIEAV